MLRYLKAFILFVVLYHILVTIFCYGIFDGQYQEIFSLIRDSIRILFVILTMIIHRKYLKSFFTIRKYPIIMLSIVSIFGIIISKTIGKWRYDILVGIKYGLRYLIIFMSAARIGFSLVYTKYQEKIIKSIYQYIYMLIVIVILGFVWQIAKLIVPDFFTWIGYGPLKDFTFWDRPPIYYLTWFHWTLRWQGIFAWPNNYGYFLIAFMPMIILFFTQKYKWIQQFITTNKKKLVYSTIIVLWIIAIILTLSRTALIGGIIWLALTNIQRIKTHKKRSWWIVIILLAGIIWISIIKWTSTLEHIQAKFGSLKYILENPKGYGLGTSWPAVHHNGTILPENYYIQLILDIGTMWFLLRTITVLQISKLARKIQKTIKNIQINNTDNGIYLIRKWLTIGRVTLLIMWIFLHVFEDSMVNYLFFTIRGILTGYLSTKIDKSFAIKW